MISRQLDDALYRLKVTALVRLGQRSNSRLTKAEIEQRLLSRQSPEEIARLFSQNPSILLTRKKKWWPFFKD